MTFPFAALDLTLGTYRIVFALGWTAVDLVPDLLALFVAGDGLLALLSYEPGGLNRYVYSALGVMLGGSTGGGVYSSNDQSFRPAIYNGDAIIPVNNPDIYRNYITFLNKLYSEGLMDPDTYTLASTQVQAKAADNTVGVHFAHGPHVLLSAGYETWISLAPLSSECNETKMWPRSENFAAGAFALSSDCAYPEAAIRFANRHFDEHMVARRPFRHTQPQFTFFIRRLHSGNLLLVNHVDFRGRNNLTAQLSFDDGKTWIGNLSLDERDGVSYPDGTQDSKGNIYIAYDFERFRAREILIAKFSEKVILAGRLVSPESRLKCLVSKADGPPSECHL